MKQSFRIVLAAVAGLCGTRAALAQPPTVPVDWRAQTLGDAVLNSVIFGALGIALVIIGFKIFDWAVTHLEVEKEISKGNVAAAVLAGAVIIAIAIIVSAAIS